MCDIDLTVNTILPSGMGAIDISDVSDVVGLGKTLHGVI